MRQELRALTLWAPWAWAIFNLGKDVENRTWAPPPWLEGRWVAIHAGSSARWTADVWRSITDVVSLLHPETPREMLDYEGAMMSHRGRVARERFCSRIVGVVRVVGIKKPWVVEPSMKGWWATDHYGMELADPIEFHEGIPCSGTIAPLLWLVRGQMLEAVREEFARATGLEHGRHIRESFRPRHEVQGALFDLLPPNNTLTEPGETVVEKP